MGEKRVVHAVYELASKVFEISNFERAEAVKDSMVNHKKYGNGLNYI